MAKSTAGKLRRLVSDAGYNPEIALIIFQCLCAILAAVCITGCSSTRDLTGRAKVCEVHGESAMRSIVVPGWGGCVLPTMPYAEARLEQFPHTYPSQLSSPWPWKRKRIEVCNFCINAEQKWIESHSSTNSNRANEMQHVTGPQIFVGGEVRARGPCTWTKGMTLKDAIAAGRGFTEFANPRRIYIHRDRQIIGTYNYDRIIMGQDQNPLVRQNDYVHVGAPCF